MFRVLLCWSASLVLVQPLFAQAPVVGPEGDPSINSDTIYSLTVDPDDHLEEDAILLLDDGILVQEPDGTGSRTYRMVAQVLRRPGVDAWAEHTWGYDGDRETFRLNWARVLDLDGNIISEEPIHQQVMDLPVPEQSPVYTNWKRVRVSLGGVEPGTIVDYSYTVEVVDPIMPGDFYSSWAITTGGTVRRSRLIRDVPAGSDFPVVEEHLDFVPKVTETDGRVVTEWYAGDLEWIEPEYFPAAADAEFLERLTLGGPNRWDRIGAWYADLAADRYELNPAILEAAEAEMPEEGDELDRLKAIYRWIAQDFRYISISLGQGGYQPRPPADVFDTRSGDCKDKATLFVALARNLGFEAYPVLLNSYGNVEEDLPSVQQFNHVIAAVRLGEEWVYLDLTAEIIPFGEVSPSYQGEFGLVVLDDGRIEEVTFPENAPEENRTETLIQGEISEDGSFVGWYSEQSAGALQYSLRGDLAQELTDRQLELAANAVAANVMAGALGDSLIVFDGRDLDAEVVVRVKLMVERAARPNGDAGYVFELPMASFANPAVVDGLENELGTRRYPIDVGQVVGPIVREAVVELLVPDGWQAQLPESVHLESPFGDYTSEYVQEGNRVRVVRRVRGLTGTEPKEGLEALIEWMRGISMDDVSFLMLVPAEVVSHF